MPWFANESDKALQSLIERWKQGACIQIEGIKFWREMPTEIDWQQLQKPRGWYTDTQSLVAVLSTDYPQLDPKPLQDVYAAITAFYQDRNFDRVPSNALLDSLIDRAVMNVNTIDHAIGKRAVNEDPTKKTKPSASNPNRIHTFDAAKYTTLPHPLTGKEIATAMGCSWKRAKSNLEGAKALNQISREAFQIRLDVFKDGSQFTSQQRTALTKAAQAKRK